MPPPFIAADKNWMLFGPFGLHFDTPDLKNPIYL